MCTFGKNTYRRPAFSFLGRMGFLLDRFRFWGSRMVTIDVIRGFLMSDKTVSTYKSRIQEKLGLSSLAALIEFATLHRLID